MSHIMLCSNLMSSIIRIGTLWLSQWICDALFSLKLLQSHVTLLAYNNNWQNDDAWSKHRIITIYQHLCNQPIAMYQTWSHHSESCILDSHSNWKSSHLEANHGHVCHQILWDLLGRLIPECAFYVTIKSHISQNQKPEWVIPKPDPVTPAPTSQSSQGDNFLYEHSMEMRWSE